MISSTRTIGTCLTGDSLPVSFQEAPHGLATFSDQESPHPTERWPQAFLKVSHVHCGECSKQPEAASGLSALFPGHLPLLITCLLFFGHLYCPLFGWWRRPQGLALRCSLSLSAQLPVCCFPWFVFGSTLRLLLNVPRNIYQMQVKSRGQFESDGCDNCESVPF